MSVTVYTNEPELLLAKIKKVINDGHIDTWEYDMDGDFTHPTSSGQWEGAGWLKPYPSQGMLTFGLLGRKGIAMTKRVYAIYHGRFIEMPLAHFDEDFATATSTAMGDKFDYYKTQA